MRKHEGTFADSTDVWRAPLVLRVIGTRPHDRPYLSICEPGKDGKVLATVTHPQALRGLANRILRSLGGAA